MLKKRLILLFSIFLFGFQQVAYAVPGGKLGINKWWASGAQLHNEKIMAGGRALPQGKDAVYAIIDKCIREGRALIITCNGVAWTYSIQY